MDLERLKELPKGPKHVATQRKRDPESLDREKVLARHRAGK